ncbi:MAG: hypothetical protein HOM55_01155 [Proteobacteria bacterium]|jgi:hypothetical protein|nr:hypothetical protein [Pseudomonadota bacterium]
MNIIRYLAITVICLNASVAAAHHSEAAYNHDIITAFDGIVTEIGWRNPHVYIFVETTDENGDKVNWKLETGSTPVMARSGWTQDSLVVGDVISVRTHPEIRAENKVGILLSIEKEDGGILAQVDNLTQPDIAAPGFSGIWKKPYTDDSPFTHNLQNLTLTEAGTAAQDAYDRDRDSPLSQCIGFPAPLLVNTGTFVFEIELLDDRMMIYSEYLDSHRTIYLDGRDHPENGERSIQGHSIGHWEDDVLVVDTRLFAEHRTANRNGVPSGAQKHVVEKYRLNDDKTRLLIDVFMEDPEYLTETFEGSVTQQYTPNLERHDYNCNPTGLSG